MKTYLKPEMTLHMVVADKRDFVVMVDHDYRLSSWLENIIGEREKLYCLQE